LWHDNVDKLASIQHREEKPSLVEELKELRSKYRNEMLNLENDLCKNSKKPTTESSGKRKSSTEAEILMKDQIEMETKEERQKRPKVKPKEKEEEPVRKRKVTKKSPPQEKKQQKVQMSQQTVKLDRLVGSLVKQHIENSGLSSAVASLQHVVSNLQPQPPPAIPAPSAPPAMPTLAMPTHDVAPLSVPKNYSFGFSSLAAPIYIPSRYEVWQQQQNRLLEERNRQLEAQNIRLYDTLDAAFAFKR
jgi:hypothetical protein